MKTVDNPNGADLRIFIEMLMEFSGAEMFISNEGHWWKLMYPESRDYLAVIYHKDTKTYSLTDNRVSFIQDTVATTSLLTINTTNYID